MQLLHPAAAAHSVSCSGHAPSCLPEMWQAHSSSLKSTRCACERSRRSNIAILIFGVQHCQPYASFPMLPMALLLAAVHWLALRRCAGRRVLSVACKVASWIIQLKLNMLTTTGQAGRRQKALPGSRSPPLPGCCTYSLRPLCRFKHYSRTVCFIGRECAQRERAIAHVSKLRAHSVTFWGWFLWGREQVPAAPRR